MYSWWPPSRRRRRSLLRTKNDRIQDRLVLLVPIFWICCFLHVNLFSTSFGEETLKGVPAKETGDSVTETVNVLETAVEETVSRVCPAVVQLIGQPKQDQSSPLLLERLFTQWWPALAKEGLLGSGFLADREGYVVTTAHVVEGVDEVQLLSRDGEAYLGKVVGRDPAADIALIKTDGMNEVEPLCFGDSSQLRQGQWVLALGSPMGLQGTVSLGIVSAVDREGLGLTDLDTYIQTDAMLGPGSSGGPLVDLRGRVVGVCTGLGCTGNKLSRGPGFAIPSRFVLAILPRLKREGSIGRGWLGVSVKEDRQPGALVTRVLTTARKELRRGDLIVAIDGQTLRKPAELKRKVLSGEPGDGLELELIRDDRKISVELLLLPLPGCTTSGSAKPTRVLAMGAVLVPDDSSPGVQVDRVAENSAAWKAGVRRGDRVLEINGVLVMGFPELERLMERCRGTVLSVLLEREGRTYYVELQD